MSEAINFRASGGEFSIFYFLATLFIRGVLLSTNQNWLSRYNAHQVVGNGIFGSDAFSAEEKKTNTYGVKID